MIDILLVSVINVISYNIGQRYNSTPWFYSMRCLFWFYCMSCDVLLSSVIRTLDCRADSWLAPSQWETSFQSNAISHWLGTNLESALGCIMVMAISRYVHVWLFIKYNHKQVCCFISQLPLWLSITCVKRISTPGDTIMIVGQDSLVSIELVKCMIIAFYQEIDSLYDSRMMSSLRFLPLTWAESLLEMLEVLITEIDLKIRHLKLHPYLLSPRGCIHIFQELIRTPAFWGYLPAASWLPIQLSHIGSQVKRRQSQNYKFKEFAKIWNKINL